MANFIRARKVKYGKALDIMELQRFGKATCIFISAIYKSN